MPATRVGGDFSSEAIIGSRELPCSFRRRISWKRSLFQLVITVNITAPRVSGSQPPEKILARLAANSGTSIQSSAANRMDTRYLFQCQLFLATEQERIEVSTMVPVTAMP